MRITITLFVLTAIIFKVPAQNLAPPNKKDTTALYNDDSKGAIIKTDTGSVLYYVSQMPTIKNERYTSFYEYAKANLIYPEDAKALNISGVVYVEFIVEIDGSVSNVHIPTGKRLHPSCDKAAIDVVSKSMWNPGVQNGKIVRVKQREQIRFVM